MIRKTLTILSLVGLLLSVGLWGVSLFLEVEYVPTRSGPQIGLFCGFLRLSFTGMPPETPLPKEYQTWQVGTRYRSVDLSTVTIKAGWRAERADRSLILWRPIFFNFWPSTAVVMLPFWLPTLIFGLTVWIVGTPLNRRRKRKKLGLCLKCGYDLRGSAERCPECGEAFEKTCSARP